MEKTRYDPAAAGRKHKLLGTILRPTRMKSASGLYAGLEQWEALVARYERRKDADGNRLKGKGGYGVKGKGKGGPTGTPGGWGKGGKKGWTVKGGEAKGGKKGGEKGWGKSGWGKGYQGQCFRCGRIGHTA